MKTSGRSRLQQKKVISVALLGLMSPHGIQPAWADRGMVKIRPAVLWPSARGRARARACSRPPLGKAAEHAGPSCRKLWGLPTLPTSAVSRSAAEGGAGTPGGAPAVLDCAPRWWPAGRRRHQVSSAQAGTWPAKSSPNSTAMIATLADTPRSKTSSESCLLHAWSLRDWEPPTRKPACFGRSCQQREHTRLVLRSGTLTKRTAGWFERQKRSSARTGPRLAQQRGLVGSGRVSECATGPPISLCVWRTCCVGGA
jgi:hypothetical protein